MPESPLHPDDPRVLETLEKTFGHAQLRPGQSRALEPILSGRNTVVVMPTGSGKSLCYQLPAMIGEGLTLVISPLISLMKDQVDALNHRGVPAASWNSQIAGDEVQRLRIRLRAGELKFLYVAPERLGTASFLEDLESTSVARVAVDEAHCVSQWGHDFRPEYLRIGQFLDRIGRPQTLALTATATPDVRDDIVRQLDLREPEVVVTGFDRPNLRLEVLRTRGTDERTARLIEAVSSVDAGAVIIYGGSRKNVEKAAAALNQRGISAGCYHAGLPNEERDAIQDRFMTGGLDVIAATNAFGMGIDRADVRLVLHWDLPGSLEAYYQEAGRAGRDGLPARGLILFSEASLRLHEFFLSLSHPPAEFVLRVFQHLRDAAAIGEVETRETLKERGRDGREESLLAAGLTRLQVLGFAQSDHREGVIRLLNDDPDALLDAMSRSDFAEREEHDRKKLAAVSNYARRRSCRRNTLLKWFDALEDASPCGNCDVCAGLDGTEGRELDEAGLTTLRKVLSGIARTRGYAGRNKIVLMLIGSRAKEIEGTWLEGLSTFGLLDSLKKPTILAWLDACLDSGLARLDGDRYPVVVLTDDGQSVMKGVAEAPSFPWPAAARTRGVSPARPSRRGGDSGFGVSASGSASTDAAPRDVELNPEERALADSLRQFRREVAEQAGVPPYVVFPDRTLWDLVEKRPRDDDALAEVHGFGPARRTRYGEGIIALCLDHDSGRSDSAVS